MSNYVEVVDITSTLWQPTEKAIGKAALVRISHDDACRLDINFQNGVDISICIEEDGSVTLAGYSTEYRDKESPSFQFTIIDADGFAVKDPLNNQKKEQP